MARPINLAAAAMLPLVVSCSGVDTDRAAYGGSLVPPAAVSASPVGNLPAPINWAAAYAAQTDHGNAVPAFDYSRLPKRFRRQRVRYFGPRTPGTIIVDVSGRYLYLVEPGGMALRYGIAVGKEGFGWTGNARVSRKDDWPTWTPPASMIERKPDLEPYADGMPGGAGNPLGARALYLSKNGQPTLYRIHGTTKPYSIGRAASSGCFRMINQDVIDLYGRVGRGAKVLVKREVEAVARLENGR